MYKIAVASSDGKKIDLSFGGTDSFEIYEVTDENEYRLSEQRFYTRSTSECDLKKNNDKNGNHLCNHNGCGQHGCNGSGANQEKVELVQDCRCILCRKIGFQVRKQLERKAISAFELDYDITEALDKIVIYFNRVDHHESLRGLAKSERIN